ncbi:MAG: undecaprenyl-diphosphate phosphatase [candidate division Zixibacteria bacterium]|nr:undecaprenyl-diphosphate phosphatase [candidate division Zixibacteria bacterium]
MGLIEGIILGVVQGLTEFLPISSSGHLVLAGKILGSRASTGLIFEVMVHFATMVAVLIYFRGKIGKMILSLLPPYTSEKMPLLKLAGIIVLGTIPAVIFGLVFEDKIESAFGSSKMASLMLLVTGLVLLSTKLIKPGQKPLDFKSGFLVGIAQAAALLPGISRSGSTISAGMHLKIDPAEAAEFSFLLSLPAVFGATLLKSFDLFSSPIASGAIGIYIAGSLTAFAVGYLSIIWLMRIIRQGRFFYFGVYCLAVGVFSLVLL